MGGGVTGRQQGRCQLAGTADADALWSGPPDDWHAGCVPSGSRGLKPINKETQP